MKKVSIIVPVYNAERYLEECIKSLINQSYKNIEIILVNDGSTDSSEDIIKSFLKVNNNIIYVSQENSGPSATRNKGLEYASGEYIMFVDSDDYAAVNLCERLLSKDSDLVMCKSYKFSNSPKFETTDFSSLTHLTRVSDIGSIEFEKLYKNTQFNPPFCKLYKKHLITTLFKEDLDLGEDIIFNFEYLKNCQTISYIDEALYYYRIGNNSSLSNKFDEERIKKVYTVYKETEMLCTEIFGDNLNIDLLKSNFLREACICIKKMIVSNDYNLIEKRRTIECYLETYRLEEFLTSDWKNEKLNFRLFFFLLSKKIVFITILFTLGLQNISEVYDNVK